MVEVRKLLAFGVHPLSPQVAPAGLRREFSRHARLEETVGEDSEIGIQTLQPPDCRGGLFVETDRGEKGRPVFLTGRVVRRSIRRRDRLFVRPGGRLDLAMALHVFALGKLGKRGRQHRQLEREAPVSLVLHAALRAPGRYFE